MKTKKGKYSGLQGDRREDLQKQSRNLVLPKLLIRGSPVADKEIVASQHC